MLDVTKSFVLQRRAVFSFGQDYRAQAVINKLGLVAVPCVDGLYRPPTAVPPRLVVSFNPHSAADARFIHDLPEDVRVVLHHQLQLSYLDVSQRAFLADCAQRAEVTVVPARFLETALQKELSPKRTRCIYNGVDTDVFRPSSASERQRYRAACGLPPEGLLIAAVGQLSKAKGVQALQRFVSMLPQNVCLVIRSLPTYKQELEELKATNPSRICIQVEDNQSRENLPTRYADLLLVLSLSEVAPMVCCEALVSGVPVITSRCTPFYDELETLGIGSPSLERIGSIPQAHQQTCAELAYTRDESDEIAATLVGSVSARTCPSDAERAALANKALNAGLSQTRMLADYAALYGAFAPLP